MAEGRTIAGVHCMDVLARLDDFVADELDADLRANVEAHLRECDWCTQFGGRYSDLVARLRQELLTSPSEGAASELAARLLGSNT